MVAAVILLGIFVLSVANGLYLSRQIDDLIVLLEETERAVEEEDWEKALAQTDQAEEKWLGQDFYHHIVLSAEILDEVAIDFQELRHFLESEDSAEAAATSGQLITRLRMTAQEAQLRPENFL
jgi:uncharacterized membrane-anchored protein YhcB (DUF1043 family)